MLLTAAPGTGKTTVIQRLASLLRDVRLAGFYTAEIRGAGFIAELKRRKDCELWTLTRAKRDAMPEQLRAWLEPREHQEGQ
ncbi:MAG TPA: nucleoside-triphosphatase [Burkholderiales bacterium]|nr:nucleoside-triphosphatase [Burkholderiales bacterium]